MSINEKRGAFSGCVNQDGGKRYTYHAAWYVTDMEGFYWTAEVKLDNFRLIGYVNGRALDKGRWDPQTGVTHPMDYPTYARHEVESRIKQEHFDDKPWLSPEELKAEREKPVQKRLEEARRRAVRLPPSKDKNHKGK